MSRSGPFNSVEISHFLSIRICDWLERCKKGRGFDLLMKTCFAAGDGFIFGCHGCIPDAHGSIINTSWARRDWRLLPSVL
jgi:hypothetical protein